MSRSELQDFEDQWVRKFLSGILCYAGKSTSERIKKYFVLSKNEKDHSIIENTRRALNELNQILGASVIHDIMTGCACRYPEENLAELKTLYQRTGDLRLVHANLQDRFLKEIRVYKNLEDEHIEYIKKNKMGMAGELEGSVITAVKIPKEFQRYYESTDSDEKPYLYCHCPRVRGSLKNGNEQISESYCLCGAGFYRAIWEFITDRPVTVNILTSVLKGDDRCTIRINLFSEEIPSRTNRPIL